MKTRGRYFSFRGAVICPLIQENKMSNDACDKILSFMQSQANGRINIPVRTRSIADAAGLTIYQARAYLVTLEGAGVVEKMNAGKGVSGRWRLV